MITLRHIAWISTLGLLMAGPASLSAQAIRVILVEEGTGNPAASSLVSLLSESGSRLVQMLADEFGRATLPTPGPGRYRVRGDRIGFLSHTSDPVTVASGDTVSLRLTLPMTRFVLPDVTVMAESRCTTAGVERRDISVVWEEARKALTSTVLTREQVRPVLQVTGHEREWDTEDHLVREDTSFAKRGTGAPFHTLPDDTLLLEGFSREERGTRMFYAPDAGALLSEAFLGSHCFTLVSDSRDGRDRVGLRFEPTPDRSVPDIAGTLWLDRVENLLREVEFEYVNVEPPWDRHRAHGSVHFERVPGLGWIVSEWRVRMPRVVVEEVRPSRMETRASSGDGRRRVTRVEETDRAPVAPDIRTRFVPRGTREQSGYAVVAESMAGNQPDGAIGGMITGVVYDSVCGSGISGAAVSLAESRSAALTDSTGRYLLSVGTSGPVRVRITHPVLDLLGVPPLHEAVVPAGGIVRLNAATPGRDRWLLDQCGRKTVRNDRLGALVGRLPETPGGTPRRRGEIRVSWFAGSVTQAGSGVVTVVRRGHMDVTTDEKGRFLACDVPLGVPVRMRVNGETDYQIEPLTPEQRVTVFPVAAGGDRSR